MRITAGHVLNPSGRTTRRWRVIMFASLRRVALAGLVVFAAQAVLPTAGAAEDVPDIAGIYEIQGETVVEGQPDRFSITGKLVVRQNGSDCTSVVEAAMRRVGGESGPTSAALIGTAEMKIEGRKFTGTAELQSLVSQIAELDVAMPFAPRVVGPVLDSVTEGQILGGLHAPGGAEDDGEGDPGGSQGDRAQEIERGPLEGARRSPLAPSARLATPAPRGSARCRLRGCPAGLPR
jgi:hypothetical protein